MVILPPCSQCGTLVVRLKAGMCKTCYERRRVGYAGKRIVHRVYCDCGQLAQLVIVIRVGGHKELMPLCAECLEIEKQMEEERKRVDHGRRNTARIRGSRILQPLF